MSNRAAGFGLAFLLLMLNPMQVSDAAAQQFGAIAFSQSTGAHGYSHNYPSRAEAERQAMIGCGEHGGGCRLVLHFYNACAALAVGARNGYGFAWAAQRGQAERTALSQCGSRSQSCRVVRWVCSR